MRTQLLVLAFLSALLWSVSAIFGKALIAHVTPETLMILIGLMYAVALLGILMIYKDAVFQDMSTILRSPRLTAYAFAITVVGFILPYWIYYTLLKKHNAYIVTALTYTTPLFVVIGSAMFLKETVTWTSVLGVLMIVGGALLCAAH